MMSRLVLSFVLCLLLSNSVQAAWKVKCDTDSMTESKQCYLISSKVNIILSVTIIDETGIISVYYNKTLEHDSTNLLRVDKSNLWHSSNTDINVTLFYMGSLGATTWNQFIQQFKEGQIARVRLYLWPSGSIEETFSLVGFSKAYTEFKQRVKQHMGYDIDEKQN